MRFHEFIAEAAAGKTLGGFTVTPVHVGTEEPVRENAEELHAGDPVVVTGNVEFNGSTGEIVEFGRDKRFVVVDLYNHGRQSFHSSDIEYNDYADSDEEEARAYDSDPAARDWNLEEALKLNAPQKSWSRQDMQDYLTRIKGGTKTKQDRFKPIIHGSNVKAITKDGGGEEWDLEDLKRQITTPPRAILGSNAKMSKSKKEGAITYDLTLPALSGIVVDEETGEFVEITTCPGAGECQLFCYARKGGYVMFPAASMSAAQALNFLVNHPQDYMQMFDREVKRTKALADKNGIKLLVRIHDAGDFFSKEYWELSKQVHENNPDVRFYFYSKMGDPVTDPNTPANTLPNFSDGGAKSREVKKVEFHRNAGKNLKGAPTIPKDMFRDLFVTDAKGKYVKDEQGRTQVKSPAAWAGFKQKLAAKYSIDPESIITYDQMNKIPEGPQPKWNVVVFPAGHGDLGATRLDVQNQFLMFH
jgi:hypothetical protein